MPDAACQWVAGTHQPPLWGNGALWNGWGAAVLLRVRELEACWWGTGRRGLWCASFWAKPSRVALRWSVHSLPREASLFLLYSLQRRLQIWTVLFHVAEWHTNQSEWFQQGFKKTKVVKHPNIFNWWNWAFLLCAWVTDLSSGVVALHLIL